MLQKPYGYVTSNNPLDYRIVLTSNYVVPKLIQVQFHKCNQTPLNNLFLLVNFEKNHKTYSTIYWRLADCPQLHEVGS